MINRKVIYVLWLREMKRFIRNKSRIVGTLVLPLFFMVFMGMGLGNINIAGFPANVNYFSFLIPGIIGMNLLFTSIFAGVSVLWDKQFGFLKEIMVAPVSRLSIVLGRTAGNVTTGLIQGLFVLSLAYAMGFQFAGIIPILIALVFMSLIATTFIGLGLIIASKMSDIQGFNLIMNFIAFPLFFMSGALYSINGLPAFIQPITYINPLTFGIDGLRGLLIGYSLLPIYVDFLVILVFSVTMMVLGAYFFEKSEAL